MKQIIETPDVTEIVYSVRDVKSGFYNSPFTGPNDASVVRYFKDEILQGQTLYAKFPEDFELFKIGAFFKRDGKFMNNDAPSHVISFSSLKN